MNASNFAEKESAGYDAVTVGGKDLINNVCTHYSLLEPNSHLAKEAAPTMAESIRQSIAQEIAKLKSQHKADDNSTPAKTIIIDDNAQQQTAP